MHVVSDSKYAIDGLTKYLPEWEKKGWIGVANSEALKEVVALLRARSAVTTLRWVKGHSGVKGNEEADKLAAKGAKEQRPVLPMRLPPPKRFLKPGASLAEMTQKLAYLGTKAWGRQAQRAATAKNVALIQQEVKEATNAWCTEGMIWKALRKDPVQRKVRDFIWKAIHGAHRVGAYWKNIPGYEERAQCRECGPEESLGHILTQCKAPGQSEAWALAQAILEKKGLEINQVTMGVAIGGHAIICKDSKGAVRQGLTRLAKIVITETTYLVWVLRCERVIGWEATPGKSHTREEIERRWLSTMRRRLEIDRALTSARLLGKKALQDETVLATWRGTLENEGELPENWVKGPGVLVGKPEARRHRESG
ncbi:hypothetical protein C8Q79DRAFT_900271 [Trametes meyenii]|nr:hypothetical protein C8Q79DRAFT_900271 [Trametes meyenii]